MRIGCVMPAGELYSAGRGGAIAAVSSELSGILLHSGMHEFSVVTPSVDDPLPSTMLHSIEYPPNLSYRGKLVEALTIRVRPYDSWAYRYYLHGVISAIAVMRNVDVVLLHNDPRSAARLARVYPQVLFGLYLHNEVSTRFKGALNKFPNVFGVTVSDYISSWLRRQSWAPARVATIGSGVNAELFRPNRKARIRDRPVVLYLGRLDPSKGPDLVVSAVELVAVTTPVALKVVGSAWFNDTEPSPAQAMYAEQIREKVQELGGSMTGFVPRAEVPRLLREADVVVVPSRCNEGFSLVAAEAMASGKVVIATRRGALPSVLGDAGILCEPDAEELAAALTRVLSNPALADQLRDAAVARARLLSWQRVCQRLLMTVEAVREAVQVDIASNGATANR